MSAFVLCRREGPVGHITLNRPQALNALTRGMIDALAAQLQVWRNDAAVEWVLIDSAASPRAFCAGGDIRSLWESGRTDGAEACRFFRHEYRLNAAIAELPKPYVALLDGVTMGGGIGVSVHGSHRIVTEHAALAMPETLIGFFPDVGGSILLNNCPGEIGMYLGLTGARLNAADALYARFATHYLPAANLDPLRARLIAGEKLEALLMELTADPGTSSLAQYRATIDRVFAADGVEDICAGLEQEGDWGRATLAQLRARSPFALKLTFAQLRAGRGQSLRDALRMEYRIAWRAVRGADFIEGVRAAIVDKDKAPRWNAANVASVPDAAVDACFAPLGDNELSFG